MALKLMHLANAPGVGSLFCHDLCGADGEEVLTDEFKERIDHADAVSVELTKSGTMS